MATATNPVDMDAPPPYEDATAPSSSSNQHIPTPSNVPQKIRNGIPLQSRRSMEDESRPLPNGWVRQYDPTAEHQFFVDTTKEPPRSIWHHPYDDEIYMNSLRPEERAKIQGIHRVPTDHDLMSESSDEDTDYHPHAQQRGKIPTELPPRPNASSSSSQPTGLHKLGRQMKDKVTGSTHAERERMRAERAQEEQAAYERHQMYRTAMVKAMETGEPQLIGKDKQGRDVYIEPPHDGYGGRGDGRGYPGAGGYGANAYGYNPYTQGPYSNPNVRFIRPQNPYSRPYYGGYGGGMGLPIGLGLGGGLLAGGLLGGAMF